MIPIYRAKKIDSDEYVIGYLTKSECDDDFLIRANGEYHFIDISTLSIHFPNMLDVKGDKIFASLNEDGKGGDILFDMEYEYTLSFDGLKFRLQGLYTKSNFNKFDSWEDFDIIGIEEWKSPRWYLIKSFKRGSDGVWQ